MAMYSNFEGTHKNSIQLGKKGLKLVKDGTTFKVTDAADALVVMAVADPTSDDHASTKKFVDDKFGAADGQVRSNAESDALYEQLTRKNVANGYVGLGTDGKIESQYLPDVALADIFTVDNFEGRNKLTVQKGDMAIITSIPIWQKGYEYKKESIVKVETADTVNFPSGFKFYYCDRDHTSGNTTIEDDILDNADNWHNSNWEDTGGDQAWAAGDESLFENILYVAKETFNSDKSPKDEGKFRVDDVMDSGLYVLRQDPQTDGEFLSKDEDWSAINVGAQVYTFAGRTGNVSPETGDYNSAQVIHAPTGDITATNVQTAIAELDSQRVKRTGDTMSGALTIAQGTESEPSIRCPGSQNSGLFQGTGNALSVAHNGIEKLRISSEILANSTLAMQNNRISGVLSPVNATDAANKDYVDALPKIANSANEPDPADGKDGDVHLTTLAGGLIKMHKDVQWYDVVASGDRYIAMSRGSTNPIAATSISGGISWSGMQMPPAPLEINRYSQVVSNASGFFLAIRDHIDPASDNGRIVYSQDGGHTWPKVSQSAFSTSGVFIAANIEADSTPYLLVGKGTNKAFTSTRGDTWNAVTLPTSAQWSCAAGAMRNYVIIAGDTNGQTICAYTNDQGATWNQSAMPASINWKSVYTTDGINYVAVGYGTSATSNNTSTAAYSHDGGANWSVSTMPTSGQWSATISNGGAYIAIRNMARNAAMSLDAGETWNEVLLPSAAGWGKLASDGRTFVALNTNTSTISPIAVSKDGGNTWFTNVDGQISSIYVRDNSEWLKFESLQAGASDFVRRTGSRMTGGLVIDNGRGRTSLSASGLIKAQGVNALTQIMNNSTEKEAGVICVGADNSDAVNNQRAYAWQLGTKGNNEDINFAIQAKRRSWGTPYDVMKFNLTDTLLTNRLGIKMPNTRAQIATNMDGTTYGLAIEDRNSTGESHIGLATKSTSATKDIIRLYSGEAFGLDGVDTQIGDITYRVRADGSVDAKHSRARTFVAKDFQIEQSGVFVDASTIPAAQGNIKSLRIKSRANADLATSHSHIYVEENGTVVFDINKQAVNINKPVITGAVTDAKGCDVYMDGTGAVKLPEGTTEQRPAAPEKGMMRFNTTTSKYEAYDGVAWQDVIIGALGPYVKETAIADWSVTGEEYYCSIPKTDHLRGDIITVQVQQKKAGSPTVWRNIGADIETTTAGTVFVYLPKRDNQTLDDIRILISA